MSDAPWSPEERAAKEAQLAKLQQLQAQRQQQRQPHIGYGYADDDDREVEEDGDENPPNAAEEAFLDSAETFFASLQQHQQQQAHKTALTASNVADIGAGATVATTAADYAAHKRVLGDFELLRLAKMGDAVSFFDFANMTHTDVASFEDNQGLNALHYAADAGSLVLIRQLRAKQVPYRTSEKGATPLDIAVLTRQPQEVLDELRAAAADSNHRDATAASKSFEDVLTRLAPAPPKFVMSKPTPTKPANARSGASGTSTSFWSLAAAAIPSSERVIAPPERLAVAVEVSPAAAADADVLRRLYEARPASCGCDGWLAPMETLQQSPALCARSIKAAATAAASGGTAVGFVAAVRAGGEVAGAGKNREPVPAGCPLFVANHLVTAESAGAAATSSRAGLADVLLSSLGAALTKEYADGKAAVAFTAPALIREPPTPLCMVKWYRRALDALPVFADHKLTENLFPDFGKYDETLRADCVAKGAIPAHMAEKHAASLVGWSCVDGQDEVQANHVLAFLQDKTAASGAEMYYIPSDLADLREGGLLSEGVHSMVKVDGTSGAITDFVAFRLRTSLNHASSGAPAVVVAELIYAVITSLKLIDKAEHLLLIAKEVLHAQVLMVPGLFGFTESDLVKANFDELTALREFAYAVCGKGGKTQSAPALPAAKLCLPLFLL